MFENDIMPLNLEINTELNLKNLFLSHHSLHKDKEYIIDINQKYIINFTNLLKFFIEIKNKKFFTITILSKYFKVPYNFIILCTNKLNLDIDNICKKLLIPYLSYKGSIDKNIDFTKIFKNTKKKILYIIFQNTKELEYYMFNFDFSNFNNLGLIKLSKSTKICDNSYQTFIIN